MNHLRWMTAVLSLAALGGCATYVNIPQQTGDVARSNPNLKNVRQVEVAALRAVVADRPLDGPFQVVLPPGTAGTTYAVLVDELQEPATWDNLAPASKAEASAGAQGPVLEVAAVRVRGWYASVDIIRPALAEQPGGTRQLVTVQLKDYPFTGWAPLQIKVWRMSVEAALRASRVESEQEIGGR